jgi:PEP-CTERM motif
MTNWFRGTDHINGRLRALLVFCALLVSAATARNAVADTIDASASSPTITSVSPISTEQLQTIVISGSGFGTQAPYTGDSAYIKLFDVTKLWAAGYVLPGVEDDAVTLIVESWADSSIVLGGFSGDWGGPNPNGGTWTLGVGNEVQTYVWNPQTGAGPASITTTAGAVPEPGSLGLVVAGLALLATSLGLRQKKERRLRLS